jgi:hypothetical protein
MSIAPELSLRVRLRASAVLNRLGVNRTSPPQGIGLIGLPLAGSRVFPWDCNIFHRLGPLAHALPWEENRANTALVRFPFFSHGAFPMGVS